MGHLAMDPDWYLDHYLAPIERIKRRRKPMTMTTPKRERWRMTLDELCYTSGISPNVFNEWADAGYLGKRLAAYPANGRGRHITRETAQRTVLVARMVKAGVTPSVAGCVAAGHKTGDDSPLVADLPGGIHVEISREDLP